MEYNKIVENIQANKSISGDEVTGVQLFRLFRDGHLKNIEYDDAVYEVQMTPTETFAGYCMILVNEKSHPSIRETFNSFRTIVDCYNRGVPVTLDLDNKQYIVNLDIMETLV